MRNATLIAAIAAALSQKVAPAKPASEAQPKGKPRAQVSRCMGMDCFCGGDCPDLKRKPNE